MTRHRLRLFSLVLGLLVCLSAAAEVAISPEGRLNMAVVRKSYTEGEFEPVRQTLETFLKKYERTATRDEKVFSHIYLGVIYAADSSSGVRAEHHFNALLDLAPNIELVDMFIPPKIQHMFDRVKGDFMRAQEYGRKYDALGNPIVEPSEKGDGSSAQEGPKQASFKKEKRGSIWALAALGTAAAVGAGVGIYYMASADDGGKKNPGSDTPIDGP
jgi:hypothetical protein